MEKVLPSPSNTRDVTTKPRSHSCLSHLFPNLLQQLDLLTLPMCCLLPAHSPCKPQPLLRAQQWDCHCDAAEKETMTKFTPQLLTPTPQQPPASLVLFPSCLICFLQPQAKGPVQESGAFGIHQKTHTLSLGQAVWAREVLSKPSSPREC